MLASSIGSNKYPGTVPALLTWAEGDTERLAEQVPAVCSDAAALLSTLARSVAKHDVQAVRRTAHRLYLLFRPFGVPQLRATVAAIEDLGMANDLGPAAPLVDDLESMFTGLCAFVEKKPWLRC
jgi:HPt (histidine-containing phosphotransfer) domain-containing protein